MWEGECRNPVRDRQLCGGNVGFVTWRSSSNGKYNFWYAVLIKSVVPLKKREVSALVFVLSHNLCDDESKFFLTVPCTGESKFFLTVLYCTTRSSLRWIKDFTPTPLRKVSFQTEKNVRYVRLRYHSVHIKFPSIKTYRINCKKAYSLFWFSQLFM